MALSAIAGTLCARPASHAVHPAYALAILTVAAAASKMKINLPQEPPSEAAFTLLLSFRSKAGTLGLLSQGKKPRFERA
jgi:hypothetical protein